MRLESVLSRCLSWSEPLQGGFAVFASSRHLVWPGILLCSFAQSLRESQLLFFTLAGRDLVSLVSFRDFLELFELFAFLFKEFPRRMECLSLRVNCYIIQGRQ